jgi:hypothetical protein
MGMLKNQGLGGKRNPNYKHGHRSAGTFSKSYTSWYAMVQRCTNPNRRYYCRYGGRGISVHPAWLEFASFLADMGERPDGTSLDRIDNDGDYTPANCRWATQKGQVRNSTTCLHLTVNGVAKPLWEWCEGSGVSARVIRDRLRLGWPAEEAIYKPLALPTDKRPRRRK